MNFEKVVTNIAISLFIAGMSYLFLSYKALANVAVRPALAKVSWWQALLAGHFTDWLVYHDPYTAVVLSVVAGAVSFIVLTFMR